jgi:hypothetical protein
MIFFVFGRGDAALCLSVKIRLLFAALREIFAFLCPGYFLSPSFSSVRTLPLRMISSL